MGNLTRRTFLKYSGATAVALSTVGVSSFVRSAEPAKPDQLIVRAWGDTWQESLDLGVSQPFTEKYGIPIVYDNTEDNIMQQKIRTAVSQNRQPPIDVNWDTTTNAMKSSLWGLSEPLTEDMVPNLAELIPIAKPELVEGWPLVSVYSYTYVLAYRTDVVQESPDSWKIFLDPKWEKSIGMYDDGIGFTPVAAVINGGSIPDNMEPAWDFYRQIKPNIGMLGGDEELTQALLEGQTPLQCCIIANVLQAQRQGAPVAWAVPQEGVVLERDALWVPKNLPPENTYWGMKYIDFALSKEAQEAWCGRLGTPPVNKNAAVPDYMQDDLAFCTTEEKMEHMIVVPSKVSVEHEKTWFEKFKEIMS
ncbi:extracellular solute-binding protein [candidate division KSB3 bacterium]|uniref:Extracellular solute-binding protein n=1 Tax=candidate division KSB3 bacterium TaxID=2044937 RepID=A0A9D5Q7P6_9BACT|nr:extracellular solute-binding protein [candidate division KSB3 bacterium]MBD3327105.1 extracellular solute-binding protein [candidate division KSB3 bacterium]